MPRKKKPSTETRYVVPSVAVAHPDYSLQPGHAVEVPVDFADELVKVGYAEDLTDDEAQAARSGEENEKLLERIKVLEADLESARIEVQVAGERADAMQDDALAGTAAGSELEARDATIAELREQLDQANAKVAELQALVEDPLDELDHKQLVELNKALELGQPGNASTDALRAAARAARADTPDAVTAAIVDLESA